MSIARALTVRLRRHIDSSAPSSPLPTEQSGMMKRMGSVIDRSKISSPVELISTTNMISYNAPDVTTVQQQLRDVSPSSSSSSVASSSASDSGSDINNRSSTDLTDASSVDASPSPCEPEPNHLSCYFASPSRSASPAPAKTSVDPLAPAIPQRALSHSKSSHMALARQRSLRSVSTTSSLHSSSLSRSGSVREQRSSTDMFSAAAVEQQQSHPFGKELEKLSEVVEELGSMMRDSENEDDGVVMREQGLCKWSVDEYLVELQPLYCAGFGGSNHPTAMIPAWI